MKLLLPVTRIVLTTLFILICCIQLRASTTSNLPAHPYTWRKHYFADSIITGRILDSVTGNPLSGVSVRVKGTAVGTITDQSGNFRIEAPNQATLQISYLGYKTIEVSLNGRKTIQVLLSPSITGLNEVVVIGYGTQKKVDVTGAVSSVDVSKLETENPMSVQDALRSNIAGLNVGFSAGAKPGGSLQIRGTNSLTAGRSPLIVLDGVIYYGALSDINPDDIEKIDVLKDASAAAVYGAKSANGVILITTKKGKPGKPTIHFNANLSLATMEVNQPVYQGEAFVRWRTDVERSIHNFTEPPFMFNDPRKLPDSISLSQWYAYDGSNPNRDPIEVWLTRLNFKPIEIKDYELNRPINWYKLVFQNAIQQNYTISLSGASERFNYYWSGGYLNNQGIVVGDKFSTIQSRLKLEGEVTRYLTVGINTQFADRDESGVPVDWYTAIIRNSPYGSMYTDDSTDYRYSPQDDPGSGARNPFIATKYTDRLVKIYTLNSIVYARLNLPFGIKYTVNFSPDFEWYNYFNHYSSKNPDYALIGGSAERNDHTIYQWQVDNIFSWSKSFMKYHHLDLTFLINSEKYQYWSEDMVTNHFDPTDILGYHNMGSGLNPSISSDDEYSTGAALMGRALYSYKDRYLLTLSFRRDGYSAFGQKYPWANFPAVALGWIFTQEPFFRSSWFNYGKLRFSYGVNGNRDIGRYSALSYLQTGKYLEVYPDGTTHIVSQLYVNRMQNDDLKWEQTASFNMGFDFSAFHDILGGTIELYKSKTNHLLVNRALPDILGFSNITTNLGEVDNKGIEVTLNLRPINQRNIQWFSSIYFWMNRNKIVHLYGNMVNITDSTGKVIGQKEADDITNHWFIGHPIDAVWDIKVLGVYQQNEAALAARYGQKPGDFKLLDVNNDGKYTNADRMFLGQTSPRYRWSFRNEFIVLKNFDLSFLIYSYWDYLGSFNQAKNREGFPDRTNGYVLPYWTPEHPENKFARIYSSDGGASYSVYRKKNFIRLADVTLAYTVPESLYHKIHAQNLRFYFTVRNVAFYAPDWVFWDPENSGPSPRTFTLGISLTL